MDNIIGRSDDQSAQKLLQGPSWRICQEVYQLLCQLAVLEPDDERLYCVGHGLWQASCNKYDSGQRALNLPGCFRKQAMHCGSHLCAQLQGGRTTARLTASTLLRTSKKRPKSSKKA